MSKLENAPKNPKTPPPIALSQSKTETSFSKKFIPLIKARQRKQTTLTLIFLTSDPKVRFRG